MSREVVAQVLGHAMMDKTFAEALHKNPAAAANSIGLHLGTAELAAIKEIQFSQLQSVADMLRSKIGTHAILDQQQVQARMD